MKEFKLIATLLSTFLILQSAQHANAADYTHGDVCSAAGAWHRTNSSGDMHFLICDGTSWRSAVQYDAAGNIIRLDNDPSVGNAGCLRYNGTSARIEFSHNCSTYSVIGEPIWQSGAGNDIYYTSGTPQVGIGTASPTYTLDVSGIIRVTDHIVVNPTAGATTPNFFDLNDLASVTLTSPSNGEVLEFDGTNWVNAAASGGSGGGLWTAGTGSDIYYNSGTPQVGIGKTDPSVTLDVVGDIQFTGTITDVSDRNQKENIIKLEDTLAGILTLQGYTFTMKDDKSGQVEYGLMAQDVEKVFPELVVTRFNDIKTLNYFGLIAPMIEAMKEQQAQIDRLNKQQAEIDSLKAELESLKEQIQSNSEEL